MLLPPAGAQMAAPADPVAFDYVRCWLAKGYAVVAPVRQAYGDKGGHNLRLGGSNLWSAPLDAWRAGTGCEKPAQTRQPRHNTHWQTADANTMDAYVAILPSLPKSTRPAANTSTFTIKIIAACPNIDWARGFFDAKNRLKKRLISTKSSATAAAGAKKFRM